MSNLSIFETRNLSTISLKPFVFISDLHFDYTRGKPNGAKYKQHEDAFVKFVKTNYQDRVLCLAGDYYDDYLKTLCFVKRLEEEKIKGFFVLGNHDFWNDKTLSYDSIIELFLKETENHAYFKFLTTGKKYYHGDICIIGDTGWTSFKRNGKRVNLKEFEYSLPEVSLIKNFSPQTIIKMHKSWIGFANNVLRKEPKVLMITHFPMVDLTKEDRDCWWSSATRLISSNSWRIFGHTHGSHEKHLNNISAQRGYHNPEIDNHPPHFKPYQESDFGQLTPFSEPNTSLTVSRLSLLNSFYNSDLVSSEDVDSQIISEIESRGYKRCAANKNNFAALINDREEYLFKVKQKMDSYLTDSYIGYFYQNRLSHQIITAIQHSINIIEAGVISDVRSYMTAAVVTGYVYNYRFYELDNMRPLDDYDIIRFWLMFLTMQSFSIEANEIGQIRKQSKKIIKFQNIEIYLPVINNQSLEVETVTHLLEQTGLLQSSPRLSLQQN